MLSYLLSPPPVLFTYCTEMYKQWVGWWWLLLTPTWSKRKQVRLSFAGLPLYQPMIWTITIMGWRLDPVIYLPLPVWWALFDQTGSRWTFQVAINQSVIIPGIN